jgi:hypothetical protein
VRNCFGLDRIAAIEKVQIDIPHAENKAVVTGNESQKEMQGQKVMGKLTMSRDKAQPSDKCDFKSTFAHNPGKASIREFRFLEFFSASTAAVFKGTVHRSVDRTDQGNVDRLEVADFANKCSGCHYGKPDPEPPD